MEDIPKPDLQRLHLEMGKTVYGPVLSRRFGWSLGVNVLPLGKKTCSLDCTYCQLGRTDNPVFDPSCLKIWPRSKKIIGAVEWKLKSEEMKLDAITFSGNGEPTLHPELRQIVEEIRKKLKRRGLEIPINIFTNSTQLGFASIRADLKHFDQVIAKLDTADQDCFVALNRPIQAMHVREIMTWLKQLRKEIGAKLTLQTIIVESQMDDITGNNHEDKLTKLADAVQEIAPATVQLYSLDRKPAEPYIIPVERAQLEQIAKTLAQKLGDSRVQVY